MTAARLTCGVLLAVAVLLGLYDLAVGLTAGGSATISWQVWTWSRRYPTIPFGAGYLCGHLFAQMRSQK